MNEFEKKAKGPSSEDAQSETLKSIEDELLSLGEPDPWADQEDEQRRLILEAKRDKMLLEQAQAETEARRLAQAALAERAEVVTVAHDQEQEDNVRAMAIEAQIKGIEPVPELLRVSDLTPALRQYVGVYNALFAEYDRLFAESENLKKSEEKPQRGGDGEKERFSRPSFQKLREANQVLTALLFGYRSTVKSVDAQGREVFTKEYFIDLPRPTREDPDESEQSMRTRGEEEYQALVHQDPGLLLELARHRRAEYVAEATRNDPSNPLSQNQQFQIALSAIEKAQAEEG